MSPSRFVLPFLLLFAVVGAAAAAHITDKLVVGLYPKPQAEGTPIRLLSSGTPIEVLQRKGEFAEVRTADDLRGWVENRYLTEEKPAKAMLLEAQTKLRVLNGELQTLKANGVAAGTPAAVPVRAPSAREAQLRQDLTAAESRISALEQQLAGQPMAAAAQQELEALRVQVDRGLELLAAARGLELQAIDVSAEEDLFGRYRIWIVGVIAILLGFGGGVAFVDYRIRKRYGGFRI